MKPTKPGTWDDVADALEQIGFVPESADRYTFIGFMLRARVLTVECGWEVQFAQKKTFDRWANSENFVVKIEHGDSVANLAVAAKHARKICRAKVFDFNTYFHPIDLS